MLALSASASAWLPLLAPKPQRSNAGDPLSPSYRAPAPTATATLPPALPTATPPPGSTPTNTPIPGSPTPSPTPDFNFFFISYANGSQGEFYTINDNGSGMSRVSNSSFNKYWPQLSSSAGRILFTRPYDGTWPGGIYTQSTSGGAPILVSPEIDYSNYYLWDSWAYENQQYACWIPNSSPKALSYIVGAVKGPSSFSEQIHKVNFDGSGWTVLLDDNGGTPLLAGAFDWKADGSTIAFFTYEVSGNSAIRTAPSGGAAQGSWSLLYDTGSGGDIDAIAWSPDGTRLAFVKNNILAVINANGSNYTPLAQVSGSAIAWSPDSSRIAYTVAQPVQECCNSNAPNLIAVNHLWVTDLTGGQQAKLSTYAPVQTTEVSASYFNPVWSNDGSRILFSEQLGSNPPQLFAVGANGGGQMQLTSQPEGNVSAVSFGAQR